MYEDLISRLLSLSKIEAIQQEQGICRITMECIGAIKEIAIEAADAIENTRKAYQMMAEAYETEVAKQGWIPVTERLPENEVPVQVVYLGVNDGKQYSDLIACVYEGMWCYWDGEPCSYDECKCEITHWQPLPEPPKEET